MPLLPMNCIPMFSNPPRLNDKSHFVNGCTKSLGSVLASPNLLHTSKQTLGFMGTHWQHPAVPAGELILAVSDTIFTHYITVSSRFLGHLKPNALYLANVFIMIVSPVTE